MKLHIPLWPLYYDMTCESWEWWNGPEAFQHIYMEWCRTNKVEPGDMDARSEVIAHQQDGIVTMIKMPTGEVVGQYEEKGLTAFEIEQARRAGDDADYFLQDAKRRQASREIGSLKRESATKPGKRKTKLLP